MLWIFYFLLCGIRYGNLPGVVFRNSVEKFEDKEKWGQLSEEKKKEERKPI